MSQVSDLKIEIKGWQTRLDTARGAISGAGETALGNPSQAAQVWGKATIDAQVAEQAISALKTRLPIAAAHDQVAEADRLTEKAQAMDVEAERIAAHVKVLVDQLEAFAGCTYIHARMTTPKHIALQEEARSLRFQAAQLRQLAKEVIGVTA